MIGSLAMDGATRRCIGAFMAVAALALLLARPGVTWELHLPATSTPAPSPVTGVVDPAVSQSATGVQVIVMAEPGQIDRATRAVQTEGGTIGVPLPLVNGFAATLTGPQADRAARHDGVRSITLNRVGHFDQMSYDSSTTASNFVRTSGAGAAWTAGDTGQGIGVAVIDTGVASHNDFAGRVVYGPDLSGEGTTIDSYGHGTVMAGIIGGSGADATAAGINPPYTGVAPNATLIAVKTAGRNGAVDVTTMLQAMHWVAAYQNQFNIRVLSLSWGVPSTQNPSVDPIDYAVERLWQQGIVVVVAAGNAGPQTTTITKPGDDPVVLSVGAYDDKQNTDPTDDSIPSWSSRGPTVQGVTKPDIVAPGRYITATRSFGSFIEQTYPKALLSPSYIRGSGTSEATAVTSGAVALLLAARPTLTPDQVKNVLRSTASPIANFTPNDQGAGRIELGAALTATPDPSFAQTPASTGLGSIEASRGGVHVQTVCPGGTTTVVIQGEIDVRCEPWDGSSWTGSSWTGSSWTGSSWTGSSWTGSSWTGSSWTNATWTGSSWTGGTWTGGSWQGSSWTGSSWTGSSWTGSSWTGSSWTGSSWTGSSWTGSGWTSAVYDDTFLTAFWGAHPAWWQNLPGEVSYPRPPGAALPIGLTLPAIGH